MRDTEENNGESAYLSFETGEEEKQKKYLLYRDRSDPHVNKIHLRLPLDSFMYSPNNIHATRSIVTLRGA